jgi:pimeloyl-ACP methyl ester carboxylesterase
VDIVASRIPPAERITIDGADHVPHISVPERYVELVTAFARTQRAADRR